MSNNPYRTQRQEWPHRATAPDARDIHLGRIATALEGILEALVGIQEQIPPALEEYHHPFMQEQDHNGV